MSRDNGMLNAAFMRKCAKIGYLHPNTLIEVWKEPASWAFKDARLFANAAGTMLPYWCLSTSEQSRMDELILSERGYTHEVRLEPNSGDRRALQTLLDNRQRLAPWTHLFHCPNGQWESVFFFTDASDAVLFRLTVT